MPSLDERFSDIDQLLAKALRSARGSIRHRGIRGSELAAALGQQVEHHLVDCTAFYENCEIRDTRGGVSQEIDLVFVNRFHPTFLLKDRPRALYIEGVAAAAEVKTSLNKHEAIDCLQKAQTFKRLVARVEGKDLQGHNIEAEDWERYLLRRPFFAFAYEDSRELEVLQENVELWIQDNRIPDSEQIDAIFVLNKGIILNLAAGTGILDLRDEEGNLLTGFVRFATSSVFSQLILWLSLVCPSFTSLGAILLKYATFSTSGYIK